MPYKAIEQPILPYFRHRFTFIEELKDISLLLLCPDSWNHGRSKGQQSDARSPKNAWGTGKV